MTDLYRLAVIKAASANRVVVVEQNGKLLPIDTLLDGAVQQKLGDITDLAPLLADWSNWSATLDKAVSEKASLFAEQGSPAADAKFEAPLARSVIWDFVLARQDQVQRAQRAGDVRSTRSF